MSSASPAVANTGAALTWVTSLHRGWSLLLTVSSREGRLLGSEFDSTAGVRHFQEQTRRSRESVHVSQRSLVVRRETDECDCLTNLRGLSRDLVEAIAHFWVAAPVHAATLALAPATGPVTSRHLPWFRSVPSL